jgi:hypothetical protein
MRSVAGNSRPPKSASSAIRDVDAIKAVCAALTLAIVAVAFRIVEIW